MTPSTGLTGISTLLHPAPALGLSHLHRTPGVASLVHAQPRPDFWGVLWSKSHHCGLIRCDPVGAYHTAARPSPESPFQFLTVTFQGISDSERSSSAAKPHWGAMMGPVSWMWGPTPRDLTACPASHLQRGDTGIHCLGIWDGFYEAQNLPDSGIMLPLGRELFPFKASLWYCTTSSEPNHHIQLPWAICDLPNPPSSAGSMWWWGAGKAQSPW